MNFAKITVGQNDKLGHMGNFNLSPVETCPGATAECLAVCYARKGHFIFKTARNRMRLNHEGSFEPGFVSTMVAQARRLPAVRLHSSGDFFSEEYVKAWAEVAKGARRTQFFTYTRSWSVPGFMPALEVLNGLPNFHLFLSVDGSHGATPEGYRLAHMSQDWERPAGSFRCPHQLQHQRKGGLVKDCISCSQCRLCFRPPGKYADVEFRVSRKR